MNKTKEKGEPNALVKPRPSASRPASAFSSNMNVFSGSSFKTPWSTQVDRALIAAPRSIDPTVAMRSSKVQTARKSNQCLEGRRERNKQHLFLKITQ